MYFYRRSCFNATNSIGMVAILVIMEDVFLREIETTVTNNLSRCRNPCYNGRCISTTYPVSDSNFLVESVAILVIMEDVFLLETMLFPENPLMSQSLL